MIYLICNKHHKQANSISQAIKLNNLNQ